MSVIRVNFVTDFYYGDPAVVVTLDGLGVDEMLAAVQSAVSKVSSVLAQSLAAFRLAFPQRSLWAL